MYIKLTIIFLLLILITILITVYFFYSLSGLINSIISLKFVELIKIIVIILLIVTSAMIIFFYILYYVSKPIIEIYKAIKQVEKGNYNIILKIKTGDEIEMLSKAFNKTTLKLGKIAQERKDLDNAKTEFLSITSHELRNPITPMKAQLQMLENEYFGKLLKKQKESIKMIIRNTDRLDNIINDLLEISKIETARLKFNFKETDIKQTIKETVMFMEGFAKEKNIKLKSNIGKITTITADPDRISQILRNIINNAIKFSNKSSTIKISAHKKDNYILFSVQDNGCGLNKENQKRVFDPFFQVENVNLLCNKGTGLGLAICRGIVESQNGKIWVESKVNHGSNFYFTIPLKPVREIKPIKVLFSHKEFSDKKVKEEFQKSNINVPRKNIEKKPTFNFSDLKIKNIQLSNQFNEKRFKKKEKKIEQKNIDLEDKKSQHEIDAILIFDENANILDCNEIMSKRLGYTKSEIILLNLLDIDILESKEDILNKINITKKDGVLLFKTIHKRKDGSVIFVDEKFEYIKNKNHFKSVIR